MNIVNHQTITIDLQQPSVSAIHAKQDDKLTRIISINLRSGGVEWEPGDNVSFAIQFQKPDGKRGIYEKLPSGKAAVTSDGSTLTATLVSQVFTAAGVVRCSIAMYTADNDMRLQTFAFLIHVEASETPGGMVSEDYYNMPTLSSLSASIGDLTKLLASKKGSLVDAINSLPQYRLPIAAEDYGGLLVNVLQEGSYVIQAQEWTDAPSDEGFAFRVIRYAPRYVLQIATGIISGSIFTRIVNRDGTDKNPVYRDWINIVDTHYKGAVSAEAYNRRICEIVKTGTYMIDTPENWSEGTLPCGGDFLMEVQRFSSNYVLQMAWSTQTGVDAYDNGDIYTRIIHRTEFTVRRSWRRVGVDAPIKVLAVGDSICAGTRNNNKGFVGDLGLPYLNAGLSGATLSNYRTSVKNIPDQLADASYDPDVLIANGGVNDYYYGAPLGDLPTVPALSAEESALLDRSTVLGGLQHLLYTMFKKYPNAAKFFLLTHKTCDRRDSSSMPGNWSELQNAAGYTLAELFDAIKQTCELYNVSVIDVFGESELDTNDDQYVTGDPQWVDDDGVHPLAHGYLHGYLPYVWEAVETIDLQQMTVDKLPQYRGVPVAADFANKISHIVQDGTYMIDTPEDWEEGTLPYGGDFALNVRRFSPNYVLQSAWSTQSGIDAFANGNIYTRIVHRTTFSVRRDWKQIGTTTISGDVSKDYASFWENKGIWASTDTSSPDVFFGDSKSRVSIATPFFLTAPMTIACNDGYKYVYHFWESKSGKLLKENDWRTDAVTIPAGVFVTITVAKLTGGTVSVDDVVANVSLSAPKSIAEAIEASKVKNAVLFDKQSLSEAEQTQARANMNAAADMTLADISDDYAALWVNKKPWGSSDASSPDTFYADDTGKASIVEPIYTDRPLTVLCSDSYNWSYITWSSAAGGYVDDSGWLCGEHTIPAGIYITISVQIPGGGAISVEQAVENMTFFKPKALQEVLFELKAEIRESNTESQLKTKQCHPVVKSIAHRGYSAEAPENTLAAYRLAKKKGFEVVEGDVYISADGIPVLLHDLNVSRTTNGAYDGNVGSFTLEELKAMDFSYLFFDTYPGEQIPTLEEWLILCRRLGLHAYLDLRINQAALVCGIVKKCGMRDHVTYICSGSAYLEAVKKLNPKARLGYVVSEITDTKISEALALKTDDNEVFINSAIEAVTDETVQKCIDADLPLETWTVDTAATIRNMNPYVTGVTSNSLLAWQVLEEEELL